MSNLPTGFPNVPDGRRPHADQVSSPDLPNSQRQQSTPGQGSGKGKIFLAVGVLICVALVAGGAVAFISRNGGGSSNSSSQDATIRAAIFGDECDGRFDKYGDKGVFDIFRAGGIQYWNGPKLPPIDAILDAVYIMDRSNLDRHSTRRIDPGSFSEQQKRQLYKSLDLYVSNEARNSSQAQWLTIGSSSAVLHGTVGIEEDSSDGRIDSPDLNICVGNVNA